MGPLDDVFHICHSILGMAHISHVFWEMERGKKFKGNKERAQWDHSWVKQSLYLLLSYFLYLEPSMVVNPHFTPCTPSWLYLLLLSCSVLSDSLQPHGLQHTRLPCHHMALLTFPFPSNYEQSSSPDGWASKIRHAVLLPVSTSPAISISELQPYNRLLAGVSVYVLLPKIHSL